MSEERLRKNRTNMATLYMRFDEFTLIAKYWYPFNWQIYKVGDEYEAVLNRLDICVRAKDKTHARNLLANEIKNRWINKETGKKEHKEWLDEMLREIPRWSEIIPCGLM